VTPERDLSSAVPWRRSLRASRERRAAAARHRRRALRGRSSVLAAALVTGALAGGAVAHERSGSSGGGRAATIAVAGTDVRAVQRALGVEADGIFGPVTRAAIRAFQRRSGLAADGIVGPLTLRALGLAGATSVAPAGASAPKAPRGARAAALERIARCESGADPTAVSADGRYRGKYQFDRATWRSLGGSGDPADAPEAEQDMRAARLHARQGTAPWPSCG
jgi:peptidoglycan hydrolase-like protein with peptidoglycan-binding domain